MTSQSEAACLVLYASARPRQWQAKTPLMTETALREVLLDPRQVGELGAPGLKLRVVSFAQRPWDDSVWGMIDDRLFARAQLPTVSLVRILEGQPVPPHLRIDGSDFELTETDP